jgi:hypothetical protein
LDEYEAGKYSPVYLTQEDLEPGSIVISEADDVSKLHVDQVGHFKYSIHPKAGPLVRLSDGRFRPVPTI